MNIEETSKELEAKYLMIRKSRWWSFLGGMIMFLLVAGVVSYQSSLRVVKGTAAYSAKKRIQKLETDAKNSVATINTQKQQAIEAVSRILREEQLLRDLKLPIGTIVPSMLLIEA